MNNILTETIKVIVNKAKMNFIINITYYKIFYYTNNI